MFARWIPQATLRKLPYVLIREASGVSRRRGPPSSASAAPLRHSGMVDRTLSLLDDPVLQQDRARPLRERSKVSKPLEKLPRMVLDRASQGVSEAMADDAMDNMNEALASNAFIGTFRGMDYPSEMVEISSVRFNQDYSHAHVCWSSEFIENVLLRLMDEELSPSDSKYSEQMVGKITDILQRQEGKFRSHFIKKFNFRRVPRIYFKCDPKLEELLKEIQRLSKL